MTARTDPERARLLGNPGSRPIATLPSLPTGEHPAPAHLGEPGRSSWATAWASGWMAPTDEGIILLLAEGMDRRAALVGAIGSALVVTGSTGQPVAHPLLPLLAALESQLTAWAGLLGLTPKARQGLNVRPTPTQPSALDRIRARRAAIVGDAS